MCVCQPVYNSERTETVAIIDIGKQGGREGGSRAEQAFAFLQSFSPFLYFEGCVRGEGEEKKERTSTCLCTTDIVPAFLLGCHPYQHH